jgi:alpha-1,3-rhamnosyltransferase
MATETVTLRLPASASPARIRAEEDSPGSFAEPVDYNGATVSVVVPSYNHAPFIGRCLHSIIRQSYSPLELIVIDDGSTDGSLKQIEDVLKDCPFESELIVRAHRGLGATINEGLRRSRGRYFAYLGSDDVWLNGFLEARVSLLQKHPAAVLAYGHAFTINEEDQILECSGDWAHYSDGHVRKMILHRIVPFSPSVLYRRAVVERHRWNEEAGLEDYDLYLRLSNEGEFAFDDRVLCAWRFHGNNQSLNLDFMLNECLKAQRRAVSALHIGREELERAHSELKWRYARDFIKAGQKRKALGLICQNLRGAPSYASIARTMLGLAIPQRIIDWRKNTIQRRAFKRYGTIQI